MSDEIKKMWQIFPVWPDSILELRAVHHQFKSKVITDHFSVRVFSSIEATQVAFENRALELNKMGYNCYTTLNPIKADFKGKTATDNDISHRDLLLIDIDRTTGTKQPASSDELELTKAVADDVMQFLTGIGWPTPRRVMSGNGMHLYYLLVNVENYQAHKNLIKHALNYLAQRFNNSDASVDTAVYNASRITKIPGTVMRKGKESIGRPYRTAVVL